jgi:hypothetical protein
MREKVRTGTTHKPPELTNLILMSYLMKDLKRQCGLSFAKTVEIFGASFQVLFQ